MENDPSPQHEFARLADRLLLDSTLHPHLLRLLRARQLCAEDASVRAAALVGSFAQGSGDRISDLDLVVFTVPDTAKSVAERWNEALGSGQMLHRYQKHRDGVGSTLRFIYWDCTSCEAHFFNQPARFRLRHPYLRVCDKDAILPGFEADGAPPSHSDFVPYTEGDAGLVWELFDCVKWMSRGETERTKRYLLKLAAKLQEADTRELQTGR